MKFISEAVAKWQLDRLESMLRSSRSKARNLKLRSGSIALEHLNLVDEHLDEAVGAIKYGKYQQAAYACQEGFFQLGLAEMLLRWGEQLDAGLRLASSLKLRSQPLSEEEQYLSFLASCLAEMKVSIEYSNCRVSLRSRSVLDRAMDFYNDGLRLLTESESESALASAQAGLLCLLLAAALIGAENQIVMPGLSQLSNPMLLRPLRRAPELVSDLSECRRRLHQREQASADEHLEEEREKTVLLRKHYEKAFNSFMLAIKSHGEKANIQAKKLMRSARRDLEICLDILGVDDPGDLGEDFEQAAQERTPVVDVAALLGEVKDLMEGISIPKKDYYLICLEKIEKLYKEGLREYSRENFQQSEKALSEALLELDLIRQQVQMRKQKMSSTHIRKRIGED